MEEERKRMEAERKREEERKRKEEEERKSNEEKLDKTWEGNKVDSIANISLTKVLIQLYELKISINGLNSINLKNMKLKQLTVATNKISTFVNECNEFDGLFKVIQNNVKSFSDKVDAQMIDTQHYVKQRRCEIMEIINVLRPCLSTLLLFLDYKTIIYLIDILDNKEEIELIKRLWNGLDLLHIFYSPKDVMIRFNLFTTSMQEIIKDCLGLYHVRGDHDCFELGDGYFNMKDNKLINKLKGFCQIVDEYGNEKLINVIPKISNNSKTKKKEWILDKPQGRTVYENDEHSYISQYIHHCKDVNDLQQYLLETCISSHISKKKGKTINSNAITEKILNVVKYLSLNELVPDSGYFFIVYWESDNDYKGSADFETKTTLYWFDSDTKMFAFSRLYARSKLN